MSDAPALDWGGLMRAGLVGLRLAPDAFWALTPAELSLMLGVQGGSPAMGRARFLALADAHPDTPGKDAP